MSRTYTIVSPPDPALTPPPGIIPDFQDPFTIRPYWIVTAALGLLLSGLFLALRLYTKIKIVKKLRWEDCMLNLQWMLGSSNANPSRHMRTGLRACIRSG